MPSETAMTGRCLCGRVSFTVDVPEPGVGVCHCAMCRRWSGGPLFALHHTAPVHFAGEDHIGRYQSSDWAERGFCRSCGSSLFYRLRGSGEYFMAVGAFDDPSRFTLDTEVFVDEKPDFYAFANETEKMTGAEVFALYAPQDGQEPQGR